MQILRGKLYKQHTDLHDHKNTHRNIQTHVQKSSCSMLLHTPTKLHTTTYKNTEMEIPKNIQNETLTHKHIQKLKKKDIDKLSHTLKIHTHMYT